MKKSRSDAGSILTGAIAGLAGTAAMMGVREFDSRYAPKTMPHMREDPGQFLVKQTARALGVERELPRFVNRTGAMLFHMAYGTAAGILYAAIRGRRRDSSTLVQGGLLGMIVYAAGYAGWLPLVHLTRPPWKQPFPGIAGEALRHLTYGVTTAAVHGAVSSRN